jgi:hypothetical protein
MSHGKVDERPEIGAPERGASVTRGRSPCCRCGDIARRRMRDITAPCVPLHRRSAKSGAASCDSGRVDSNHVQDSRRRHRAAASLFCEHRNYVERDCHSRNKSVSLVCKQEWLSSGNGSPSMSILTTSSTVSSFTNCNKRMRFSFPITFAPLLITRS